MATDNPFEAPMTDFSAPPRAKALDRVYGGIGRLAYFGYTILVGIVAIILILIVAGALPQNPELLFVVQGAQFIAGLFLACWRAKNLGANPWWGLTILIPLYNILVGIRLIAYPPGWEDHRQLDTPGKVIVGLFLGLFALMILALVLAVVMGGS